MFGDIIATGFSAALPAFQVIGGIDRLTPWTGIVFSDFPEPLLITDGFYPFKIIPKFDPVRHCRLKLFQVIAGIFPAFAAKVDATPGGTGRHFALLAIK